MSDLMLEKSLINSHCLGVDSIVVKDSPNMIRFFIAHDNHELWKNNIDDSEAFSIAIHGHHSDVTLIPIFGEVWNVMLRKLDGQNRVMTPYKYTSPITGHRGRFEAQGNAKKLRLSENRISGPTFMPATQMHTVFVPRKMAAAWWVWEGKENDRYIPIAWSDADLSSFDFTNLNQPMTEDRLREDLAMIGVCQ